jgi:hypothetical protein
MVVKRGCTNAETPGQTRQAEGVQALGVDDLERRHDDRVAADQWFWRSGHLNSHLLVTKRSRWQRDMSANDDVATLIALIARIDSVPHEGTG